MPHDDALPIPEFDEAVVTPTAEELVCPVYTRPNHEFKFADFCRSQGLVHYLPMRRSCKVHNVNSNGKCYSYSKEVLRAMFTSYVFVRLHPSQLQQLFDSRHIVRVLPVKNRDRFLKEIRLVRQIELIARDQEVEFHRDIVIGDQFLIQTGPWAGSIGWLSRKDKTYRWTVEIEFADQRVTTIIDPSQYRMTRLSCES